MGTLKLSSVRYTDRTGYATHVQIEVTQELAQGTRSAAFVLPLRAGRAELDRPGLEQVIALAVQPVISRRPGEVERLGSHAFHRATGGDYVEWARVETAGQLIHRTTLRQVMESPPRPLVARRAKATAGDGRAATRKAKSRGGKR